MFDAEEWQMHFKESAMFHFALLNLPENKDKPSDQALHVSKKGFLSLALIFNQKCEDHEKACVFFDILDPEHQTRLGHVLLKYKLQISDVIEKHLMIATDQ